MYSFIVALTSVICIYSCSLFADEQADQEKLDKVKKAIAELKAELEATKGSRAQMLKSLEKSEKEMATSAPRPISSRASLISSKRI